MFCMASKKVESLEMLRDELSGISLAYELSFNGGLLIVGSPERLNFCSPPRTIFMVGSDAPSEGEIRIRFNEDYDPSFFVKSYLICNPDYPSLDLRLAFDPEGLEIVDGMSDFKGRRLLRAQLFGDSTEEPWAYFYLNDF